MDRERPHVFGTETEWSAMIRADEGSSPRPINELESGIILNTLPGGFIATSNTSSYGGWGRDGSRIYRDFNAIMESATPEHTEYKRLIASERLHAELVNRALMAYAESHGYHSSKLIRRVYDRSGNSRGYHISHSVDADKIRLDEYSLQPLAVHLATQNIYAGAGTVYRDDYGETKYAIAQKALTLTTDFNLGTTHSKPVMNLRDEALADPKLHKRVHITSEDAAMSPWVTSMQIGTSELVLGAMEQRKLIPNRYWITEPGVKHPLAKLAVDVAQNPNIDTMTRLEKHGTISVLDLQEKILEDVSKSEYSPQAGEILTEWEHALDDLRRDPERLADRSDWAAKLKLIRRYMGRHGLEMSDDRVAALDMQWSVIGSNLPQRTLSKSVWDKWSPDEVTQKEAIDPPKTTRALVRGNFAQEHGDNAVIDWSRLALRDGPTIIIDDPLRTEPLSAYELGQSDDPLDEIAI